MTVVAARAGAKQGCGVLTGAGLLVSPDPATRDQVVWPSECTPRSTARGPRRRQGGVPVKSAPGAFGLCLESRCAGGGQWGGAGRGRGAGRGAGGPLVSGPLHLHTSASGYGHGGQPEVVFSSRSPPRTSLLREGSSLWPGVGLPRPIRGGGGDAAWLCRSDKTRRELVSRERRPLRSRCVLGRPFRSGSGRQGPASAAPPLWAHLGIWGLFRMEAYPPETLHHH